MAETEILLAIKKLQVLGSIIFESCRSFQKIQNSIKVLESKTFKDCNTPQKI